MSENFDKASAVKLLNQIMEAELAGVVRYTHYSLMIFGHNRIPIVSWLRGEATICLTHANEAGELVTHFGEHPSLKIGALLETHQHGINDILLESLEAEKKGLNPNIWFGNVERVASERIGRETVTYVSNIYKYYVTYRLVFEQMNRREAARAELGKRKG